jgi:basic amino acid/polyamine antiporter, APA family
MTERESNGDTRPPVSMLAATAVVIADMIGVGVFTSLGFQAMDLKTPSTLLLLWLIGGIVALCGAFCYAELGSMFPRSSGEYNFLTRAYHPALGFMAGWLSATVGFSAPVALAALALADYVRSVAPAFPPTLVGLTAIWGVSLVHLAGLRQGSAFQLASTGLKILIVLAFICVGLFSGGALPVDAFLAPPRATEIFSAPFAISLVYVMYSYSGWNAATYIVGEIHEPRKNLPRAVLLGSGVVMALYILLNGVFLYSTPIAEIKGKVNVAQIAATHIFGTDGGGVADAFIALSLISTVSAMMWIGPRVLMTMGEDLPELSIFARVSKSGAPRIATLFQLLAASLMLVTQSFEKVLEVTQFNLSLCSFLTVLGLIKLRWTHSDAPRPYRAFGYPFTPIIFLVATGLILYHQLTTKPVESLGGASALLAGLLLYFCLSAARKRLDKGKTLKVVSIFLALLIPFAMPGVDARAASADDNARVLAGLAPAANSPLSPIVRTAAWRSHAAILDAGFKRFETQQAAHIREWSRANLTTRRPNLFYMFSGPDFLYANNFFSDAQAFVLVGLEPVGAVPDIEKTSPAQAPRVLRSVTSSLNTILSLSFFKTNDMRQQFRASPLNGALPVIYVFLSRSGKVVQSTSLIRLDETGDVHPATEKTGGADGVKIVFSSPGGQEQTLYYFSANLADGSFKKTGIEPFCAKLGEGDALLKSASYLMHSGGFSQVRDFLLRRANVILQDDTGIPVANFGPEWSLKTYGSYVRPIKLFSTHYQPKLAALFGKEAHSRLPFRLGYHLRLSESNLLLAVKTGARSAPNTPISQQAPASPAKN